MITSTSEFGTRIIERDPNWSDSDIPVLTKDWRLRPNRGGGILYSFSNDEHFHVDLTAAGTIAVALCNGRSNLAQIKALLAEILSIDSQETEQTLNHLLAAKQALGPAIAKLAETSGQFTATNTARILCDLKNFVPRRRDIHRLDVPLSLVLLPTYRCATDCVYCYAERPNTDQSKEMSPQRWAEILDEAGSAGLDMLIFSGGDPLMYRGIMKLLEAAAKHGMCYLLPTKTAIKPTRAAALADVMSPHGEIQVSVDSFDPDIAQAMTRTKGYAHRARASIENLQNVDIPVRTNTVVTPLNYAQVPELIRTLRDMGVHRAHFTNYNRSHYRHDDSLLLEKQKIQELENTIERLREELAWETLLCGAMVRDFSIAGKNTQEEWETRASCSGGYSALTILPNGNTTLCEQVPDDNRFVVGSVANRPLMDVWNSQKLLDFVSPGRDRFKGTACESCEEFDDCHGHHGRCFRDSYFTFGKVFAPSPNCPQSGPGLRMA